MLRSIAKFGTAVIGDSIGLTRVCGPKVAMRWLGNIPLNFSKCVREQSLQSVDRAMGEGPFRVSRGKATALMSGPRVLSGIREIWVRDVYLSQDFVKIPPDGFVVDLGANMGNFTLLALGHGPGVRVVSVEPNSERNARFGQQLEINGWQDRAVLHRCFIGGRGAVQEELLKDEHFQGAEFLSQDQFIEQHKIDRIDFLKCDIEGSEFELLHPGSPILKRTQQLALEVHYGAGDADALLQMLRDSGFEIGPISRNPKDCTLVARRVRDAPSV